MGLPERWRTVEGSDQKLNFTASSAQSVAVGNSTYAVLLSCTQNCHIAFGSSPVATANNWLLKNTDPGLILGIAPGEKIAAIQDSAAGYLSIVELTA